MSTGSSPEEQEAEQRLGRAYRSSLLPVMREHPPESEARERAVLLAVYAQVCDSWRTLTDVRFKLLALLPPVAGLGLFAVVSSGSPLGDAHVAARLGAATFGLLVTIGLYIYDRRNSELYDDLISRGRRAETELGVDTGVFLGRRNPRPGSLVRHGTATTLIYATVIGAWAGALLLVAVTG